MARGGAVLRRRLLGAASGAVLAALVAGSLLASGPARADDLDDKAAALQEQANQVQSSLEFVDSSLAKAAADLTLFQGQLPGAQQALADAQTRVGAAAAEAEALAARVDLAQQNKDKITAAIEADKKKAADAKKVIGQIAAQTYKSGGVPTNLGLLLGSSGGSDLARTMDMADSAMRSQKATLDKLSAQNATNINSQARLAAVEAEIADLKAKADAALAAEQAARDEAAAKKAAVDKLIADAAALNAELTARKPEIEAKLAAVESERNNVAGQIAERQRQEREAAEKAAREAAAAAGNGSNYVPPAPGNPSAFGLRHPFAANIPITSGFGWRAVPEGTMDFNGTGYYLHSGIDFGAPCGTPIYAPADGTVVLAGQTNVVTGGGNVLWISHGVVQGNALMTVYYHNSSVIVSAGQRVQSGQLVGYSGNTGNSTGCHAHFETWLNGSPVDPLTVLGG
ncbi:peptidoglycan DD-metalloendopeptidase family protein [Arthrobacter sp. 35W]|uniref:peptidoglycan DD-metalloendopeptidase family protein n=1 Tax=Arthrobacter sp. 35W TaxID=1132441 RepID=UPI00047C9B81|nr:M23 family metallopeptidase [Arthrobacter sp. 35W]